MSKQREIPADDHALAWALTRWENEGGRPGNDHEPRVAPARAREHVRESSSSFRLIKAAPLDRDAVAAAFEALATKLQQRDGSDRVTALQRAIDEHPERFAEYCRATGT